MTAKADNAASLPAGPTACDGQVFKRLAQAGRDWLDRHHALVNQLNVFPVPDGDTGTNMLMTMRNAIKEIETNPSDHVGQVAAQIAHGAMMGSRGNSGTILSQLWQGFAHALRDHKSLTPELLVKGLREASDTAYRGVIKPVEGTILTVVRESSVGARAAADAGGTLLAVAVAARDAGAESLRRTPELLPVLRDAGVRCQHQRSVRGLLRRRPASALSQAASSRAVMARKSGTAQSG